MKVRVTARGRICIFIFGILLTLPVFIHISSALPPLPIGLFPAALALPVSLWRGKISRLELIAAFFLFVNIVIGAAKLFGSSFAGERLFFVSAILQLVIWPFFSGLSRLFTRHSRHLLAGMFWGGVAFALAFFSLGGLRNIHNLQPVFPGISRVVFYQVYDYSPSLLAFVIPFGVALAIEGGLVKGAPYYIGTAFALLMLFHMDSRASIVVAALGVAAVVFTAIARIRRALLPSILGTGALLAILAAKAQIQSYPFATFGGRLNIWRTNLQYWLQTPTTFLFGVDSLASSTTNHGLRLAAGHNQLLDIAAKQGLLALLAFLALYFYVLWSIADFIRKSYQAGSLLYLGLAVSVLFQFLLNAQLVLVSEQPIVAVPLWISVGLVFSRLATSVHTQTDQAGLGAMNL